MFVIHEVDNMTGSNTNMKKTFKEFQEQELEKTFSPKFELGSQSVSEGMTSRIAKVNSVGLIILRAKWELLTEDDG